MNVENKIPKKWGRIVTSLPKYMSYTWVRHELYMQIHELYMNMLGIMCISFLSNALMLGVLHGYMRSWSYNEGKDGFMIVELKYIREHQQAKRRNSKKCYFIILRLCPSKVWPSGCIVWPIGLLSFWGESTYAWIGRKARHEKRMTSKWS